MRRLPTTLSLLGMTAAFVVVPTVSLPAAAARPLSPTVKSLPVTGLNSEALASSPAPEVELEAPATRSAAGAGRRAAAAVKLAPLVATGKLGTSTFSAVGVTWAADPAVQDVAVQVRTRNGGRWSAWTEVEVQPNATGDRGTPESKAPRAGSDPLYVGTSNGVQVRVDSGTVKPRDVRVELIDPQTSASDKFAATTGALGGRTVLGGVAHAAGTVPAYVSRAGWGADESLRSCTPSMTSTIKGGILHTTATGNDYTADRSAAIMRSMYAYHTKSLGWCDIGYNFVVDKFGTLFEGRFGGVDKPILGSHTGGFNSNTFGVSMIGNHDLMAPTAAMRATVERVFAWKLGLYGIKATGTTTYTSGGGASTKWPYGTSVTMPVISGHRDYSSKSCPGNYAYPMLSALRQAVEARMNPAPASVTKAATTLALATTPSTIVYGGSTTISGRLTSAAGEGLAARTVTLYVRKRGTTTWNRLSTRTTGSDGRFSGTHAATSNLDYRAVFLGDDRTLAARRDTRVDVKATVSAWLSTTSVRSGGTVVLTGTVKPGYAGQAVHRQILVNGTWRTLATAYLSSTGTYRFTFRPIYRGTNTYRVLKPADANRVASTSALRKLTVR